MKPEWYKICESPELHARFRELACSFTRNPELREDLYQEAWLAVCEYLSGIQPPSEGYKGGTAPGGEEFLVRGLWIGCAREKNDIESFSNRGQERRHTNGLSANL